MVYDSTRYLEFESKSGFIFYNGVKFYQIDKDKSWYGKQKYEKFSNDLEGFIKQQLVVTKINDKPRA